MKKSIKRIVSLVVAGALLVGSAVSVSAGDQDWNLPAGALLSNWRVANATYANPDQTPRVPEGMWAYRTGFDVGRTDYASLQFTDRPVAGHDGGLNFMFVHAPQFLIGADWLQTNNNARNNTGGQGGAPRDDQMVLTAAQDIYVIVGVDSRSAVWVGAISDNAAPVQPTAANVGTYQPQFEWLSAGTLLPFNYYVTNNEAHTNLQGRTDNINIARPVIPEGQTGQSYFYLWKFDVASGQSLNIPSMNVGHNGNFTVWLLPAGSPLTDAAAGAPATPAPTPAPTIPGDAADGEEPKENDETGDTMTIIFAVGAVALLAALIFIKKRKTA